MPTTCLSAPSARIQAKANEVVQSASAATAKEKAIALYNFVRDSVSFGFTRHFDSATPEQTLTLRRGHCNPQAALLASLLNAANIPAKQHFVALTPGVLRGILVPAPAMLMHSYVEAEIDGRVVRVDGFIADKMLWEGAKTKLEKDGMVEGWGVHCGGGVEWDGDKDLFVQMVDEKMQVKEDFGAWDKPQTFLGSDKNFQRLPWVARVSFGVFAELCNRRIAAVRGES